jgi:hypothetical protein
MSILSTKASLYIGDGNNPANRIDKLKKLESHVFNQAIDVTHSRHAQL